MTTDHKTIDVYNARSADYAKMARDPEEVADLTAFIALLPPKARVLDLGCGPGLEAARMIAAGAIVDAVDASPEMVKTAHKSRVPARVARFEDITETSVYDAVWASFSLLHAPRADLPGLLGALHRAIEGAGFFYLGMKLGTGEHRDDLGRLYSYFSADELRAALDTAGFEILSHREGASAGLSGKVAPFLTLTCRKIAHG